LTTFIITEAHNDSRVGDRAALAAVVACAPSQPREAVAEAAGNDPAAEVIAASKAIVAAFGRDDQSAYFALFDPAATFLFYTTPQRLESRAAYEEEWAKCRRDLGFRVRSCTSSDQRVQVFNDVAILTHFVRTDITTTQGDTTLHERETTVFHRRQGKWVAVHEHLSPRPSGG
jgi:ketosteroid isomerase-like protein